MVYEKKIGFVGLGGYEASVSFFPFLKVCTSSTKELLSLLSHEACVLQIQ
jgi:hypothetical protein